MKGPPPDGLAAVSLAVHMDLKEQADFNLTANFRKHSSVCIVTHTITVMLCSCWTGRLKNLVTVTLDHQHKAKYEYMWNIVLGVLQAMQLEIRLILDYSTQNARDSSA